MCGEAVVGEGEITIEIAFNEFPISVRSDLLVLNGGAGSGMTRLFAYAYLTIPVPASVVTTVKIRKIQAGRYGTLWTATIPKIAGGSGSIKSFSLRLDKKFTYKGEKVSVLTAKCPDGKLRMRRKRSFPRPPPERPLRPGPTSCATAPARAEPIPYDPWAGRAASPLDFLPMGAAGKVCVIGAGSSGIASCQVLRRPGIPFDCFEKGSEVGGNWRYENDNGMSSAYRSLHINTSRGLMAYRTFPMPERLSGLPEPLPDRRLLRRLRRPLRPAREDPLPHRGRRASSRSTASGR